MCDQVAIQIIQEWQWVTPAAIFASGMLGATVAYIAIHSARDIARKKNSADIMFSSKNDARLKDGIDEIRKIHLDDDIDVSRYALDKHAQDSTTEHIRYVLNYFEYISVGIAGNIYDEGIIKASKHTTIRSIWDMAEPYVEKRRELKSLDTLYIELEHMLEEWKKRPLTNRHKKPQ